LLLFYKLPDQISNRYYYLYVYMGFSFQGCVKKYLERRPSLCGEA
jgi:hypothetical protein